MAFLGEVWIRYPIVVNALTPSDALRSPTVEDIRYVRRINRVIKGGLIVDLTR